MDSLQFSTQYSQQAPEVSPTPPPPPQLTVERHLRPSRQQGRRLLSTFLVKRRVHLPIPARAVGCITCSLRRLTNTPPPPPRLPFHGERRPARVGSTADDSPPLPNDASKGCPSPAPFCSVRRLTNKTPPPPRLPLQGERRQARVVNKASDSPTFPTTPARTVRRHLPLAVPPRNRRDAADCTPPSQVARPLAHPSPRLL
ncbi:hypothetical protein Ae201684P_002177 [Aphanomyces euteiches]|uniref:Uncharacterized protein n=1 Tax=Aphanomyces euteiches TaxID=100861 RepID=A0A6G0XL71_9STRA|nr:hypothetical protein Ae201684_003732 [Aphanomyces euteiches]KAH9084945.1 hypothetical protein Ae201684P_002177 [Aphanomyces euteiches]